MSSESTLKTLIVAAMLCLVCSILVSTAAVQLKPFQEKNKILETKKNILLSAGLLTEDSNIEQAFKNIEPRIVNLQTGKYIQNIDANSYNMLTAAKEKGTQYDIPLDKDLGKIKYRAKYAKIYLVKKQGKIKTIILPIYGKGLWSTMYAFMAIKNDLNTIQGLSFYEHGETPGLGGEVDNILWKKQWIGKRLYDISGQLAITLIKGKVDPQKADAIHQIDGLAGATLTTIGIQNFINYWLGDDGYGLFLKNLQPKRGENEKL